MHGATGPLGQEIAQLLVMSVVVAWMAWLWTEEEVFEDFHKYFGRRKQKTRHRLTNLINNYPPPYDGTKSWGAMLGAYISTWVSMIQTWFAHKFWFMMGCPTCFLHYPAITFILLRGDHLVDKGWIGVIYAWMFVGFSADFEIAMMTIIKTTKKLEASTERAISAGAVLLEQKIKNPSEIGPISVQSRRGSVAIGSPTDNFPNLPQNVPMEVNIPVPRQFNAIPSARTIILPGDNRQ